MAKTVDFQLQTFSKCKQRQQQQLQTPPQAAAIWWLFSMSMYCWGRFWGFCILISLSLSVSLLVNNFTIEAFFLISLNLNSFLLLLLMFSMKRNCFSCHSWQQLKWVLLMWICSFTTWTKPLIFFFFFFFAETSIVYVNLWLLKIQLFLWIAHQIQGLSLIDMNFNHLLLDLSFSS